MKKNNSYTSKDIQVLSDFEHVRLRTNVYLGNMNPTTYEIPVLTADKFELQTVEFIPSVLKCLIEIIDNSSDELLKFNPKNKTITVEADPINGTYTVADNGRGVPIDMHETGKYTPEVVFGSLRSGRNFDDGAKDVGQRGTNGVGSSCVMACSTNFDVTIYRDGKRYLQKFSDGGSKVSNPKITENAKPSGTQVCFSLDPSIFKTVSLPPQVVENTVIDYALTNPGLTVEYNGTKYKFKKGLQDLVEKISPSGSFFKFEIKDETMTGEIFVLFDGYQGLDEKMLTWVNSCYLFDGGLCNTQVFNALVDNVIESLKGQAKKAQCEVTKNDVRQNLLVLSSFKIKNPEYDAQSKTRYTGPSIRNQIQAAMSDQWAAFNRKSKDWYAAIIERAVARHNIDSNKKAEKTVSKQSGQKVPGLRDATSKIRSKCRLFVTEGLSAAGQITEVRNPEYDAIFTLTGKMNNVYGANVAQLMKMGKIVDLIAAIGLIPGKKADRSALRYGSVILSTDADHDGDDIFTLLVNLFNQFWPELLDPNQSPFILRLNAPNVVASKNGKRVHFSSMEDFKNNESKYKGWTIEYMKGLGSMIKEDWEMLLTELDSNVIWVYKDEKFDDTMELLFGDDANKRKQWLTEVQ